MSEILGLLLMMRMMRRRMRCWWCCWLLMLLLLLAELVVGPYSSWLISLLGEGEWEGTPPLGLKQGGSLAAAPLGGDTCKHSTERGGQQSEYISSVWSTLSPLPPPLFCALSGIMHRGGSNICSKEHEIAPHLDNM